MRRWECAALVTALGFVALGGCAPPAGPVLKLADHSLTRTIDDCPEDPKDCTHVTLDWPVATGGVAAHAVNTWINSRLLAGGVASGDGALASPESVTTRFLSGFREFHSRWPDAPDQWFLERKARVILDSLGVVTVRFDENSFTGGAHGMHATTYASFSSHDGRKLALADLVIAPSDTALAALGEQAFRVARRIPPGHTLADEGFFGEGRGRFAFSKDFAVTRDGLTFQWDEYEIAPYAWGPTTMTIPWRDLRPYVRRDGPLAVWVR
jgi:hypothetical protein